MGDLCRYCGQDAGTAASRSGGCGGRCCASPAPAVTGCSDGSTGLEQELSFYLHDDAHAGDVAQYKEEVSERGLSFL
jgi:hypothetical protein